MIVENWRVGASVAYYDIIHLNGVCNIAHVEEGHLDSLIPCKVSFVGFDSMFTDSDQVGFIVGMQIVGVSWDV